MKPAPTSPHPQPSLVNRARQRAARYRWQVAFRLLAMALIVAALRGLPEPQPVVVPYAGRQIRGAVMRVAGDQSTITIAPNAAATSGVVWRIAANADLKTRVKTLQTGDRVVAVQSSGPSLVEISQIAVQSYSVSSTTRLALMGAIAVILGLFGGMAPSGSRWLVIGADNRYSNSLTQGALWFWMFITTYVAAIALRVWVGGPTFVTGVIPAASLIGLSSISALSYVGARQIVAARIDSSPQRASRVKPPSTHGPRLRDLFTDDSGRRPDFGDFQMLVVTIVAVAVFAIRVYGWLETIDLSTHVQLPDIDTTLLGAFGIGQAAYLSKKLAGDSGNTAAPPPVSADAPPRPPLLPTE